MNSHFQQFFADCAGTWISERTYHYLTQQEVERSHTEFVVQSIERDRKAQVLVDNQYSEQSDLDSLPGYHLESATVSEKGDRVNQALNMLFVPKQEDGALIVGDYLRDRAYDQAMGEGIPSPLLLQLISAESSVCQALPPALTPLKMTYFLR